MVRALLLVVPVSISPALADAATIWVDPDLDGACDDYDPATRSCGAGSEPGRIDLDDALGEAVAGDVIELRAGEYGVLVPSRSGAPGLPITIRAHAGEAARITDQDDVALQITRVTDLVIEGIEVTRTLGFGRLEDASRITIHDCRFQEAQASGTTGGLKLVRSSDNRVLGNVFVDGNDTLLLQDSSDRNLVEGNTFQGGRHSLVSIRCANRNLVRGNTFDNPIQKAVEIFDCEAVSDAPYLLDATRRNVLEGNVFAGTAASDSDHDYNAIQHGGQQTLVRQNVFHDCLGGGAHYQVYSDESLWVWGNRLVHNTFVDNRCFAITSSAGEPAEVFDNRVAGNLLFRNSDCAGGGEQLRIEDPGSTLAEDNVVAQADPGFVDLEGGDLRLAEVSALRDSGAFLTTVTSDGEGTLMPVADAAPFSDGLGIDGEVGDLVQLEGSAERVRLLAVDLEGATLTLGATLAWTAGQGVHWAYGGAAPDPGAFEIGLETQPGDGDADADADGDGDVDGDGDADGDGGPAAGDDGAGCDCSTAGDRGRGPGGLELLALAAVAVMGRRVRCPPGSSTRVEVVAPRTGSTGKTRGSPGASRVRLLLPRPVQSNGRKVLP